METERHAGTTVLAALHGVDKHFGEQTVLEGATLELRATSRCALIGRNGAGKSTILRLLAGTEEADGGSVYVRPDVEVAVLDQDLRFRPGETVRELSESAFARLDAMEDRLRELEAAGLDDAAVYAEWDGLHETFQRRGGYARRSRRDAVLDALGFAGRLDEPVDHLSGGEKTRLGLARLLMQQPDLLLLDEPTNHLDMAMRDWLGGHLARYGGATLLISHDRDFLDSSCQQTAEIRNARLRLHDGNPGSYHAARAEQDRIEELTRINQRREQDRLESAAAQMKQWAGQNAKLHRRARAMERRAERHADDMLPDADAEGRTVRFLFESGGSGDTVLQAEHLSRSTGGQDDRVLFRDVRATLRRGDRIALLGPNGAGKTTLLKTLLGELPSGDPRAAVRFGARVRVGYYDQELRDVDPERTLIEELIRLTGDVEAHNLLGRFLFPFDAQYKRIADLSGGERARLALLKLTMGHYNLLVLDEPTNHLDVEMIEALEEALVRYEGTLLLVSHDRRFVSRVANTIWELEDGHLEMYAGDLGYWRVKRDELRALRKGAGATGGNGRGEAESAGRPARPATAAERDAGSRGAAAAPVDAARPRVQGSRWQLERRLEALETEIAELEESLRDSSTRLEDPAGLTPEELQEAARNHAAADERLRRLLDEWEAVGESLAG